MPLLRAAALQAGRNTNYGKENHMIPGYGKNMQAAAATAAGRSSSQQQQVAPRIDSSCFLATLPWMEGTEQLVSGVPCELPKVKQL